MNINDYDLVRKYKDTCAEIADAVAIRLFPTTRQHKWVGDRIGGICDFGNANFLTMGDMVLILETDMDPKGFFEWSAANEENKDYISLHCWLQGVRHSDFYGK